MLDTADPSPPRTVRRTLTLILAAFGVLSPAAAESRYCLQGRIWGYPGNCQFATRQQWMATAAGTGATCGINPRYARRR